MLIKYSLQVRPPLPCTTTPILMAGLCVTWPRRFRESGHVTTSADMWSLGAVLTYIANDRKHLFRTEVDVFRWTGGRSPTKRVFKHSEFHDLVRSLLSVDKYNRPSV